MRAELAPAASPRRRLLPTLAAALLVGCATGPTGDGGPASHVDVSHVPDAVPRQEPPSRYGNPVSYVVNGKRYHVMKQAGDYVERGVASWYGTKFHGRRTASGEPYDMYAMTAAHRSLPLPTYVRVTNLANGRSVVVKVNDRGPFHDDRIIDLSYAAASKLGMLGRGTAQVEVRVVGEATVAGDAAVDVRPATLGAGTAPAEPLPAVALAPLPGGAPAASSAPVASPVTLPSAPASMRRLYLQVGAFSDPGNAEQLRERLQRTELGPVAVHASGDAIYRVRLGPFASPEEAESLAGRLAVLGLTGSRVYLD